MVQSIQSNAQPFGGMVATQPITPAGQLTPTDIAAITEALTPVQARFRQQSTFIRVGMPQAQPRLGTPAPVQVPNVGLGVRLVSEWNVTITVANAATSAEVMTISPLFPYNLINNVQVNINGGAAQHSAGGPAILNTMLRQRRGTHRPRYDGLVTSGATAGTFGPSLDYALLRITLGSNLTATIARVPTLSGIASISVAGSASTNNTMTLTFITIEKVALDLDSLLGALPIQNNATFCQVIYAVQSALSGTRDDRQMPFYTVGADLTFTLTTCNVDTMYQMASVPGDPALYGTMVANSYQVQEQVAFVVSSTGVSAFLYTIPTNQLLVALTLLGVDGNGVAMQGYGGVYGSTASVTNGLSNLKLTYNAQSIQPVLQFPNRERALAYLAYDADQTLMPGTRVWDGEDTSDDIASSDDMGWLNCYAVANPQIVADVGTSTTTNLTTNITREAVVAGAVQQIGG